MSGRNIIRAGLVLSALVLAATLASCRSPETALTSGGESLEVAPEFSSFWTRGGGLATFGPPISPARRTSKGLRQAFLAVEMVASQEGGTTRVALSPLGWELGLAEPPVPPIDRRSSAYFSSTGHTLYAGFAQLYEDLGGEQVLGAPISEVAFRNGEIVQYFENAGMVRPENASPAETRLVALGLSARPPSNTFGLDTDSLVLSGLVRQRPFETFLAPLGGEAVFGQPLTDPYLASDGALEQVYERAVVFSPDGSVRSAGFRSLGAAIGPPQEPVPASKEKGARYFKTTGHNVQWAFADFYRTRNGETILGDPLEEATLESNRMAQRFENGILEYRFDLPPELAVQLAPLGRTYLEQHPQPTREASPAPQPAATPPPEEAALPTDLQVHAELGHRIVAPAQEQRLTVTVVGPDGNPIQGASITARFLTASGVSQRALPPSDSAGTSTLAWTEEGTPAQIVTVVVEVTAPEGVGRALTQYANGFAPAG